MRFLNALQSLLGAEDQRQPLAHNQIVQRAQQPQPSRSNPNDRPPVRMPQAHLPQNYNPLEGYSTYGDASGNQWYENEETGHRIPIRQQPLWFDAAVNPQPDSLRPKRAAYPATLPVQYYRSSDRQQPGGFI